MTVLASPHARSIERVWPDEISLGQGRTFGRSPSDETHVCLPDQDVALRHCRIILESTASPKRRAYRIEDLGSGGGTFVNRELVTSHRLREADLVQIGPFAWTFSETDGYLVPAGPIAGLRVDLRAVAIDRLTPLTLTVRPGELTAVIGASGAGKSTFVKAVLAPSNGRGTGALLCDGRDVGDDPAGYRRLLGYFSQEATLHRELSARQAVRFAARLRGRTKRNSATTDWQGEDAAERTLHEVDLPQARWDTPIKKLSGGERQRARLAAELVAGPRLLLLDEPTSGLDSATEAAVLRRLRGLAVRGGCVVVVTHGLSFLHLFDRVLVLGVARFPTPRTSRLQRFGRSAEREAGAEIVFDGRPPELRARIPSGRFIDLADADLTARPQTTGTYDSDAVPTSGTEEPLSQKESEATADGDRLEQVPTLLQREFALLFRDPVRRLALPILAVPLAFALALSAAVPPDARHLMGFLAILSCVWGGASLSLMSVVNEREVYDHERLLFLKTGSYLLTKTFVAWVGAAVQAGVFVAALRLMRGEQFFHFPVNVYPTLVLAGVAGSSLGLLISAGAGRSREAANFILPLVMIAQIVFGVQVAGHGDAPLYRAPEGASATAVAASYLTISRPADVLLRTGSYWSVDPREAERHRYALRRRHARIALVAHVIAPIAVAYLALSTHSGRLWRTLRRYASSVR